MLDATVETAEGLATDRLALSLADLCHLSRHRFWRLAIVLNITGLLLLAVVLRCVDLGNLPGINGDEAWYGVQAELCLRGEPIAWRTPSGNLLNPLFFGPQLAMHLIFEPSFVVLRATALASGLLALIVNFWLCRRVFGGKIAIIATTILAVLPIDIAYSRLAWDASQSLLATLPCIYFPLWAITDARLKTRSSMAALASLAAAIIVHPTNLFVAPIVVICLGYAWREDLIRVGRRMLRCFREQWQRTALLVIAGGLVAVGALGVIAGPMLRPAWIGPAMGRIANPPEYAAFSANFGRIFSGATVYEYVSGAMIAPQPLDTSSTELRCDCIPYDLAAWMVGVWMVCGLARCSRRFRPTATCLAVGLGASLFGFFLVAGPGALAPNFERYAIWMVAPTAILAALALGSWQERPGRAKHTCTIASIVVGWVLLCGFQTNCLGFLRQTGGRSHRTFHTAAVEPKQAALAYIVAQREPNEGVNIATSEWWIYWPMRYLSMDPRSRNAESPVSIELLPIGHGAAAQSPALDWQRDRWWRVEFTDSEACKAFRRIARASELSLQETAIHDFARRPLLTVFAVGRKMPSAPVAAVSSADPHDYKKN